MALKLKSSNNSRFAEFLPLIYPPELEIKETTETASSPSFLDLYLEFDDSGQLGTNNYDKWDDFNFKAILVDFIIFMQFHFMKIHRSPLSLKRQNIFRQYQVRVITVFPVFRLLIDFVCLYTHEF
jgi:hypothetical protein